MDRILQQIMNMFLRKIMNKGINMGVDYAARRGKSTGEMTPAERDQAKSAKTLAKRAKQVSRITRRLGR